MQQNNHSCTQKEFPKKKVALVLGYNGKGYHGMQKNNDFKTIEEELFNALKKSKSVRDNHVDDPYKMSFQRCARTDKGVSAAVQVVSLKMNPNVSPVEINKYLPEQIRVFAIYRVKNSFDSKRCCTARTYNYIIPSFVLKKDSDISIRLDNVDLSVITNTMKKFIGTNNFHNYTSNKEFSDSSSKRYILDFMIEKDILFNDVQFIVFSIKGQSFLLHQIRKIIAMIVCLQQNLINPQLIDSSFTSEKINIPMAPSNGLYLQMIHYELYNERCIKENAKSCCISFEEDLMKTIEEYKKSFIVDSICQNELNEKICSTWLKPLRNHKFSSP